MEWNGSKWDDDPKEKPQTSYAYRMLSIYKIFANEKWDIADIWIIWMEGG